MFISENHNLKPFGKKLYISSPTRHPGGKTGYEELDYIREAFDTNWLSTVGHNIDESERMVAGKVGVKYAVGLTCGTDALHLAVKLAGVKRGDTVFSSDMTFVATCNPILYEGGIPVFLDAEYQTWNMDPVALEKAFSLYPDTKVVILAHLYGTPGKIDEIREICKEHGAFLIEDAAESLGATYKGKQTGSFGDIGCISCNGNKIITGSEGGFLLTDDERVKNKAKKWSTQSREPAPWYQHTEIGYNYRLSNIIAGMIRGQIHHLEEHIEQKKAVWERYRDGLKGLPVTMNPIDFGNSEPNYWLSCLLVDKDAMCRQVRSETDALYAPEHGKSCPTEILERIAELNTEGRPIWKPMHLQPLYYGYGFVTREGDGRKADSKVGADGRPLDVGADIFDRGLCLPSDNKMEEEEQERIIEVIRGCFE